MQLCTETEKQQQISVCVSLSQNLFQPHSWANERHKKSLMLSHCFEVESHTKTLVFDYFKFAWCSPDTRNTQAGVLLLNLVSWAPETNAWYSPSKRVLNRGVQFNPHEFWGSCAFHRKHTLCLFLGPDYLLNVWKYVDNSSTSKQKYFLAAVWLSYLC